MAGNHTLKINSAGETLTVTVAAGTRVYDAMTENGINIPTPCSGKGTCGKCKITINGGGLTNKPADKETKLLGKQAISKGIRLACYTVVDSDMEITADPQNEAGAVIRSSFKERNIKLDPYVRNVHIKLKKPSLEDQTSDLERAEQKLKKHTAAGKPYFTAGVLGKLAVTLRQADFSADFILAGDDVIDVRPGKSKSPIYGIAVDIGTTTVVAYLIDLVTGARTGVHSSLNPQRIYGADVISRINHLIENPDALSEINDCIRSWINDAADHFCEQKQIKQEDIYAMVLTGNTTMLHFAMNISPVNIASAPFIPVTTKQHIFKAQTLGININPEGRITVMPAVASYIGGDTVAAVLSSGMYTDDKISLLIDLGTNGEIVLGSKKWLYACSAAAGPAFEGANIRNGVAGIKGAIDSIKIDADTGKATYTTIGKQQPPVGICGSGILDAVAEMLSTGIIDETGRIDDENDRFEITDIDGMTALVIDKAADIAVTQKDIRELQNAKAAIAAGIRVLINQAGIKPDDIAHVYLAGGFGSYIRVESALKIGLLPAELRGRVESTGNSAGAGAIECLRSVKSMADSNRLHKKIKYIELSSRPDFMDEYIDCMMFE